MAIQEIALLWVPEGLEPLTSCTLYRSPHATLGGAIAEFKREREDRKSRHELPWLRAGTGEGAAVLNVAGILLLEAALNGGP